MRLCVCLFNLLCYFLRMKMEGNLLDYEEFVKKKRNQIIIFNLFFLIVSIPIFIWLPHFIIVAKWRLEGEFGE